MMIASEQQVQQLIPWPYVIRRSARVKSLRISVSREQGVEVVYPRWSSRKVALQFLLESHSWLNQHQEILQQSLNFKDQSIPSFIDLKLLKQRFDLACELIPGHKIILQRQSRKLLLQGEATDLASVAPCLKRWLLSLANEHLTPKVRQISTEIGLPFNKLSWRLQKTLWGSCSPDNNISLNLKLLFVQYELFRYVVVHELCHTRFRSHGPRFWALVRRFDVSYSQHDKSLKDIILKLPLWLSHL